MAQTPTPLTGIRCFLMLLTRCCSWPLTPVLCCVHVSADRAGPGPDPARGARHGGQGQVPTVPQPTSPPLLLSRPACCLTCVLHPPLFCWEWYRNRGLELTLVKGGAESLPMADGSFDAVVSTLVLCSVADPAQVLREVHRVLRPGGRYCFIEHVRGE